MEYANIYEWGKNKLSEAKVLEAALDARLLLEYACKTTRQTLLAHPDREVLDSEEKAYRSYIEKRSKRIPLQHITGEQEFMGLSFIVNDKVLIPRQDTEILVEEAMKDLHDGFRILDMCTGSGCILLSLLYYSNDCSGIGADISSDALMVANANRDKILKDGQKLRASFIKSDMFDGLQKGDKFELIVSNPPYIKTEVIGSLMPEVRDFEPHGALDGGNDGLEFYKEIADNAFKYLTGGGRLLLEIGYDQAKEVASLLENAGFSDVTVIKDYAGLDRVISACKQGC